MMIRSEYCSPDRLRKSDGKTVRQRDPAQRGFDLPCLLPELYREIAAELNPKREHVTHRIPSRDLAVRPIEVIVDLAQIQSVYKAIVARINQYGGNGVRSWLSSQVRDNRARVQDIDHRFLPLRWSSRSISSCFRSVKASLDVATNEYFPLIL